jgi:hypothetical protein
MPTPTSNIGIIDLALKTAILNKFAPIMSLPIADNNIVFMPKEIALREVSEKRGKDSVGFISFWANEIGQDWDRRRTPMSRQGVPLSYTSGGQSRINIVKAVPVRLQYEIVFWHLSLDAVLKVVDEYLFWPDVSPTLDISFNSNLLNFQLQFADFRDESTLREKYSKGTIYIYSTSLIVEGWLPKFELDWAVNTIFTTLYDANSTPPIKIFSQTDTQSGSVVTYKG